MEKIITNNELETNQFGAALGKLCRGGEVFLLCGDLGAGKTHFAQGLAKGLGVSGRVNSPTFNIMKLYQAKGPVAKLCHIDAYRLNSEKDLEALGIGEYLGAADTVTVIEWAEKVKKIWPRGASVLSFKSLGPETREISVGASSGR